ncbi:MAG: Mth938-like domain-containing protein [Acidiferrobacter sp.]
MKIHLDTGDGRHLIRGYRRGQVVIGATAYERSLIVLPDRLITDWPPVHFGELTETIFDEIAALGPEIVLLGTGTRLRFPPPRWLATLSQAGVGTECMDTGAACRTYNLLMNEGRHVAAALLLADPPDR